MEPIIAPCKSSFRRRCRCAAAGLAILVVWGNPAGQAAPAPMNLAYEVTVRGLPILTLNFRISETQADYSVSGLIRTIGIADWMGDFAMRSESRGVVAADALRPRLHESTSHSRRGERRAHLDYAADGTVAAALTPSEDPGHPLPTPQQTKGTLDPLSAVLALHREVARSGSCRGTRMPVFDGRRRYDLVLADDGVEPKESTTLRRCSVDMVKIAGFSADSSATPHSDHGEVWIQAGRVDAPSLPVRLEFKSNWGPITVRMTRIDSAG